jgi:hypothetical protein
MSDETKTVSIAPEDVFGCGADNGTDVLKYDIGVVIRGLPSGSSTNTEEGKAAKTKDDWKKEAKAA